jgi:hypothetical protein
VAGPVIACGTRRARHGANQSPAGTRGQAGGRAGTLPQHGYGRLGCQPPASTIRAPPEELIWT